MIIKLITPSKEAAETTDCPTHPKTLINDLPVDISETLTNHLQKQIMFLQIELKNKTKHSRVDQVKCVDTYVSFRLPNWNFKICLSESKRNHGAILPVGTNGFVSENSTERIAKSIADLAENSVKDHRSVSISRIIYRNDNLNTKVEEVNVFRRSILQPFTKYSRQTVVFLVFFNSAIREKFNFFFSAVFY